MSTPTEHAARTRRSSRHHSTITPDHQDITESLNEPRHRKEEEKAHLGIMIRRAGAPADATTPGGLAALPQSISNVVLGGWLPC